MTILFKILFYFLLVFLFAGCLFRQKEYVLYAIIERTSTVNGDSKVLLEGREIGRVDLSTSLEKNKILVKMLIHEKEKIPRSASVKYRENILGNTYIDISSDSSSSPVKGGFIEAMDTLKGNYETPMRKIDSSTMKVIFHKLEDLKNTLDSAMKKKDTVSD